jgi:hypothetical protein
VSTHKLLPLRPTGLIVQGDCVNNPDVITRVRVLVSLAQRSPRIEQMLRESIADPDLYGLTGENLRLMRLIVRRLDNARQSSAD